MLTPICAMRRSGTTRRRPSRCQRTGIRRRSTSGSGFRAGAAGRRPDQSGREPCHRRTRQDPAPRSGGGVSGDAGLARPVAGPAGGWGDVPGRRLYREPGDRGQGGQPREAAADGGGGGRGVGPGAQPGSRRAARRATRGDEPLFQDLRKLLVNLHDPDARVVRNVLVFMERRTRRRRSCCASGWRTASKARSGSRCCAASCRWCRRGRTPRPGRRSPARTSRARHCRDKFLRPVQRRRGLFPGQFRRDRLLAGASGRRDAAGRLAGSARCIVAERYYAWTPTVIPAAVRVPLRDGIDGVCTLVCPNRLAFHLVGAGDGWADRGVAGARALQRPGAEPGAAVHARADPDGRAFGAAGRYREL